MIIRSLINLWINPLPARIELSVFFYQVTRWKVILPSQAVWWHCHVTVCQWITQVDKFQPWCQNLTTGKNILPLVKEALQLNLLSYTGHLGMLCYFYNNLWNIIFVNDDEIKHLFLKGWHKSLHPLPQGLVCEKCVLYNISITVFQLL